MSRTQKHGGCCSKGCPPHRPCGGSRRFRDARPSPAHEARMPPPPPGNAARSRRSPTRSRIPPSHLILSHHLPPRSAPLTSHPPTVGQRGAVAERRLRAGPAQSPAPRSSLRSESLWLAAAVDGCNGREGGNLETARAAGSPTEAGEVPKVP